METQRTSVKVVWEKQYCNNFNSLKSESTPFIVKDLLYKSNDLKFLLYAEQGDLTHESFSVDQLLLPWKNTT